MNILITGATGQLGNTLTHLPWPHDVTLFTPTRQELNLEDTNSINTFFAGKHFDSVIHCAAYTAVDKAEDEPERAMAINADATKCIAELTLNARIPLIYISTDYVFNGRQSQAYKESDAIDPINVYGRSKALGEQAVRLNPQHFIVRTSWLVSAVGHNFIKTMLRLALSHHEVRVVADQWGAPTSAVDLAQFIQSVALSNDDMQHKYGTYHFSNEGQTHWAALAEHVFDIAKRQGKPFADVRHISTQDYPTRAKRPAHSLLDLQLTKRIFGVDIRPWQDAVTDIVTQLCATTGSVT